MKVCEEVAEYKIHTGKKVLDPEREHAKLEEIRKKAHGEFNELGARSFFSRSWPSAESVSISFFTEYVRKKRKELPNGWEQLPRNNVTVVFQGVEGAYSYGAMRAYFQEDIKSYHVKLFGMPWKKLQQEEQITQSFLLKIPQLDCDRYL